MAQGVPKANDAREPVPHDERVHLPPERGRGGVAVGAPLGAEREQRLERELVQSGEARPREARTDSAAASEPPAEAESARRSAVWWKSVGVGMAARESA